MTRRVSSYRLSEHTLAQIEALSARMGSAANVIAFAIDRMYLQERKSMGNEITINGGVDQVWDQFVGDQTPRDFIELARDANSAAVEEPTISEIVHAYIQDMPQMYNDWEFGDPNLLYIRCTDGRHGYLSELLTELLTEIRDED